MKKVFLKIFTILGIFFISFFINVNKVNAVDKCIWHTYEPGIYYDSSSKTYKGVVINNDSIHYTLKYDSSKKKSFEFSGSGEKFKNEFWKSNLEKLEKCPEYISVSYTRRGTNGYKIEYATQSEYMNYIKNVYGTNFGMFDAVTNGNYDVVTYNGLIDTNYNIEENDKKDNENPKPIYYTSKEFHYLEKDLKLEKYEEKLKSLFERKLSGLNDKGKDINYKEDFYESTNKTWSSAINSIKKELKNNCSDYTNKNSNNREEYLDLLDHDIFPKILESNEISSYSDSEYKDEIQDEKCYKTVVKARYMQVSFSEWWKLVDWLMLTKIDNENGDIDKFYDYYEFAYLSISGGSKVRPVYEALEKMKKGNVAINNNIILSENECSALCYDYDPKYQSTGNSSAYENCINTRAKKCENANSECKSKISNIKDSNSAKIEYDKCMKSKIGEEEYQKLQDTIIQLQDYNNNVINSAVQEMVDILTKIETPDFLGIEFNSHYVPDCKDFEEFHTIYKILTILAPILVILFGSLDYAKAVVASDIEKMEKSKKAFPKRLLLLVLFIMVPFIISFLISTFSSVDTNIAKCVVNGS